MSEVSTPPEPPEPPESSPPESPEPSPPTRRRSITLVLVVGAVVIAVGSYVLWDMRFWDTSTPPAPTSHLKVLGRDDPATLEREAEERTHTRARPSASATASASTAPSASAGPASR